MKSGNVDVSVAFGVRNSGQLQNFINLRKKSNNVETALSEDQFEAEYSPTQSDYARVVSFLLANLSITQTWPNRLLITAEGTVADVQRAFHTQIGLFLLNGTTFYNCTGNIQVPTSLSSCEIANINVNSLEMQFALSNSAGLAPYAVAYNSSPADFRDAYGTTTQVNGGWNGTGTTIAIVDAYGDPTIRGDVDLFNSHFGLPSLNLTIAGTGGTPVSNWDVETAMDVEWAHARAPNAAITLQLVPNSQSSSLFAAVNTLVQQENPPNIISLSWSGPETSSYSYIFEAAAAKESMFTAQLEITALIMAEEPASQSVILRLTQMWWLLEEQPSITTSFKARVNTTNTAGAEAVAATPKYSRNPPIKSTLELLIQPLNVRFQMFHLKLTPLQASPSTWVVINRLGGAVQVCQRL